MPNNETVKFYLRFLSERFGAFRTVLDRFLIAITLENRKQKLDAAQNVMNSLNELKGALSEEDYPSWIATLEGILSWYQNRAETINDAGLKVFKTIMQVYPAIEAQKWNVTDSTANSAVDFAAIYQEAYDNSRVSELFNEVVIHLEKIIESGEIDSLTTIKTLEKLIATIRKNAQKDYFSTRGAWDFTQIFVKNLSIEILENIPGIKHLFKALTQTMSELDSEMIQVHDQIRNKVKESVAEDLPMLKNRSLVLPEAEMEEEAV